ncbi:iron-containing redox enzyme family protein, partial [Frankia sp. KB5]
HRPSDGPLFAIYADEMGRGDIAKNHITLIQQALASMDIHLPHPRSEEFLTQAELPDLTYPYATYQLSLALFPDSRYEEILGYSLGVEMFGLGELRLHEMEKMRHHRFDIAYEAAHLSIDNVSAGHARQATDLIVGYLDHVGRTAGPVAVERAWQRVWRGYASFAFFVEPQLARRLMAGRAAA